MKPGPTSGPATGRSSRARLILLNVLFASFGYVAIRLVVAPVRIKLLTSLLSKEDYGSLTLIMLTVSFTALVASLGSLEYMLRKLPARAAGYQLRVFCTIAVYFGGLAILIGAVFGGILLVWRPERIGLRPGDIVAAALILVCTVHLLQLVFFLMSRSQYAQSRLLMLLYADAWFLPVLVAMWFVDLSVSFMLWLWVAWLWLSLVVSQGFVRTRAWLRYAPSRSQLRRVLVFGVPLMPMILGEWIFQVQDRYVLLAFTDLVAVANYTLCFNIAWVAVTSGTSLLDLLITEFYKARNRVATDDFDCLVASADLRRAFTLLLRSGLALSIPIVLGLWYAGLPVILLLSDPQFADAAYIMRWVAPLPLLYLLAMIAGRTLMAIDRGRVVGIGTAVAAGVQLVLLFILTPWLAERGVALGGCLAYGLLAIYLGYRVRLFRWINWADLRPWRLTAFTLLSIAGWQLSARYFEPDSIRWAIVGGSWSLVALFGCGGLRWADLQQLKASIQGTG